MNFYTVLGIPRNADDEAIRHAYRVLVRRYHPDLGIGSSTEEFRQVTEAYETLIDHASRRSYDLSLQRPAHHPSVPIEPTVAQSSPLHRENPRVFGRFAPEVESSVFQGSARYDDMYDSLFRSLEEVFYEIRWPW